MESRQCSGCGKSFRPRSQVRQQRYCGAPACQRERRRLWQLAKRKYDPDYHDNQLRAQRTWRERYPDYWRKYRQEHPDYSERNRTRQLVRNDRSRQNKIAKMNVSTPVFPISSGIYNISRAQPAGIAKIDVWTVQITLLPTPCGERGGDCKERT
jgi:hypothetical protein